MIVKRLGSDTDTYADFSVEGNVITFSDQLDIDLESEEQDDEVNIPICSNGTEYHRDLHPGCAYVAQIIIPPRKYDIDYVDVENQESGEFESKEVKLPIPFDVENVVLRLWPILLADISEGDQASDN
jgi:hypothetical protein